MLFLRARAVGYHVPKRATLPGPHACRTRWSDAAPGPGGGEEVWVHPSSVVAQLATPQLHHPYLVYLEKVCVWGGVLVEWGVAARVMA